MKTIAVLFILLLFFLGFSGCGNSSQSGYDEQGQLHGRISISGAWAMYPLVVSWADEFRQQHPGVRIDISAGGAGKGMADVLGGMVDMAMVSREITPAEVRRGAWFIPVARDAVVPTFNLSNPYRDVILRQGLRREQFMQVFLENSPVYWEELMGLNGQNRVSVYTRSDACGAAEVWSAFLGSHQEDLQGIGVFGDPGIADIVRKDPLGMGFNNIAFAFDINTRRPFPGLAVIPLDIDGNGSIEPTEDFYETLNSLMEAISLGIYPSPPARELYFVCKGEPADIALQVFLEWIMQQGQEFVAQAGYIALPDEVVALHLTMLQAATTARID